MLLVLLCLYGYGVPVWFGGFPWAIRPLSTHHPMGIFLGAFIHGSWDHLWGNLVALLVLSRLFMIQFPNHWLRFWLMQHVMASSLLWLIGAVVYTPEGWRLTHGVSHIGASIWVYAFVGFLISMGVLQKTKQSMGIFFLVLLLYGQIWAFMPIDPKVSWQGHLSGLLTGILIALWKGKLWLQPIQVNADSMNETAEDDDHHQEPEDPYMEL